MVDFITTHPAPERRSASGPSLQRKELDSFDEQQLWEHRLKSLDALHAAEHQVAVQTANLVGISRALKRLRKGLPH